MPKVYFANLPPALARAVTSPVLFTAASCLVAASCYLYSLKCALVHDDIFAIRDNPDVRPETPMADLFRNDFWGKPMASAASHKSYRPLTVLTFRLNFALHGLQPAGYHAVNVALHAAVTALFGWCCRRAVFGYADLSLSAALLFATHPVHSEAVTGVVGRADVLACLLFLLTFMAYRSSALSRQGTMKWVLFLSAVVCGVAALLCKEHGITVFAVCFAYDLLVVSNKKSAQSSHLSSGHLLSPFIPFILRVVAVMAVVLPLLAFRVYLMEHMPHFSAQDNPASFANEISTRVLTYAYLLYFNARLLVAPITLCYDWQMGSIPLLQSLTDVRNIGTVSFLAYLLCLSLFSLFGAPRKHKEVTLLGLLFLVVPFIPASNLFIRVGFVVAERILYIPSMGYCILVVQGIKTISLYGRPKHPNHSGVSTKLDTILLLSLMALVGAFSVRTIMRNPVWSTRESLFRSGLATLPNNAKIHFNYGNFLKDSDRSVEAIEQYRTAISLAPDHAVSHNNLGTLLLDNLTQAEVHFREAVKHNPQHYRAFFNLGKNLQAQGRLSEAEAALRESIRVKEDYHDAFMNLAMLMADSGRIDEGWSHMQKAAALAPTSADVMNNVAAYLLRLGKKEEAIDVYLRAIKLNPLLHTAMTNLARVYRSVGRNDEAEDMFKRSLTMQRDAATFGHLGALYFNTGKYQLAANALMDGLQMEPGNTEMACSYGLSLMSLGKLVPSEGVYRDILKRNPLSGCAHFGLAGLFNREGSPEKALVHSEQAVTLVESSSAAEAYYLHGGILKDLKRLREAVKAYRSAIQFSPGMVSARMNLGAVLHMMKEYAEAKVEYEVALKLDPSNEIIKDNLIKLDRAWKSAS